jgi:ribosomal protein S18 acetylase RimI-like enzyme
VGTISDTIGPGEHREGLMALVERVTTLVTANETLNYYLYECRLTKRNEDEFRPKITNFTLKRISNLIQLNDLTAQGFDLSLDSGITRRGLERGAIAFLLFVDQELATREMVAMNAEAKTAIDKYPYKVDFANKEACASAVWTNPKFRRLGLHSYVFYKAYDYLREIGIEIVRSIVWVDNVAAQRAHEKFAPDIKKYARGSYFKVMGLHFCKETPLK